MASFDMRFPQSQNTMSTSPKALFTPLQLGPLTLKNRVLMSPLTRNRAVPTNVPNPTMTEYYRQRAGAGLIVSEAILVSQQGTEWPNVPGLWSDEQVNAWKQITDAVHGEGSYIYAQLWHLGRTSHPDAPEQIASGQPVYAPSAIAARGGKFRFLPGEPGYVTPTAIDDPLKLIELFKTAAVNAKAAGFDGVEVHGANGYLVNQFLDTGSNHRTDEWGGSVENRCRFGLTLLSELCKIWGSNRVAIRVNPAGGILDVGMPLQDTLDTFSYFISEADKLKLAYICIIRHNSLIDPPVDGKYRGTPHDVLAAYAPLVKESLVIGNTDYTPEEAAAAVESGQLAAVFFGRLWIRNPDLAKRIQYGKALTEPLDFSTLYHWEVHISRGYTDQPPAL